MNPRSFVYPRFFLAASPGILIETDDNAIRFGLAETPGYGRLVLPLQRGVVARDLVGSAHPTAGQSIYSAAQDGKLADNWVLLCDSRQFPDVPLVLTLKENPTEIIPSVADGELISLTLRYESQVGYVIAATPFGLKGLQPQGDAKKAVQLSRFWSKALLACITDCKEYYKVDWAAQRVAIFQAYEYRRLTDAWGSAGLETAPYPPALAVAAQHCRGITLAANAVDLGFPTKYGPLKAVVGSARSAYTLPIPPVAARIPLAPTVDTPAKRQIRERHRPQPHAAAKPLTADSFPGFWSRPDRSIVDAASMAGELAFLWPYLDEVSRQALKANMRAHVMDCLDDQELFQGTALFQSIQRTPRDADKLVRPI